MENGMKIRAVIVDDDKLSIAHLTNLISKNAHEVEIVATFENPEEALEKIPALAPQLLFLDVEMPGLSGFDLLKKLPAINFEIIFTTAHDQYAIRAIRFAALDYLLKPIRPDTVQETIDRVKEKLTQKQNGHEKSLPLNNDKELNNLAIPTLEGLLFVNLEDVVRCESDDKYTKIYQADKKMILASRTLGDFEDLLGTSGFFRIHKSHLINLKHLKRYIKGEGGQVVMSDGSTLDVSRRKKDDLLKVVSQF